MDKGITRSAVLAVSLVLVAWFATALDSSRTRVRAQEQEVNNEAPANFVRGRVLVKFRSETRPDHARQIIAALGARDADEIPDIGVHILDLPAQANERAFVRAFEARPEVEFAELDMLVAVDQLTPNDPHYMASEAWELQRIAAPNAWPVTTGTSNVVIAILDTGVDGTHEDLTAKMVPGWNIVNNNSDTRDVHGHGTKVAGTAGASSNNGVGVTSIAWGCGLMPIRVADSTGYATYSAIASGLNWAADHGARVANISFYVSESSAVTTAAKYFQGKGGIVTTSAGNSAAFNSGADNLYMLTVSATDETDSPSFFSNYGNNTDLGAPEAAFTTMNGGGYTYAGGTSFSAPIVAGVAALVLSINPGLTPAQVQDILKQSADDLGNPGWDAHYGWGRVNAERATKLAAGGSLPTPDTTAPVTGFSVPTQNAMVSGVVPVDVAASDNVGVVAVTLTAGGVQIGTDTSAPYTFSFNTTGRSNGACVLVATARDAAGNTSSATITVTVNNPSDSTPPAVVITSPANGSMVSGNVNVAFSASDNVRVVRIELYLDGKLSSSSTTTPFAMRLNARKISSGVHNLQARAYDAAGNVGVSQVVSVFR